MNGYGIKQLEKMVHLLGTLHVSKLENTVNVGDDKLNEKKRRALTSWCLNGVIGLSKLLIGFNFF